MARALVIDDDVVALDGVAAIAAGEGFDIATARTIAGARLQCSAQPPDVTLLNLYLPDGNGMDLLRERAMNGSAVVVITDRASIETAVEALRLGATDYLTKPLDVPRVRQILTRVLHPAAPDGRIGVLRDERRTLDRFGPLVGMSSSMTYIYELLQRVGPTDATICLIGETGTGKELVARAIHECSRRRDGPFVAVNCGAMQPDLIESTLFGHERGSFTGADAVHRGVFERASGGTLFLDEVMEMPSELQIRLLRSLESGVVMRVGGEQTVEVDVRIIGATNRDPNQALQEHQLREDLWYRLNVFPIRLPPLRERRCDIALLAQHFLDELNGANATNKRWTPSGIETLEGWDWPGNVRELKNAVHRAYILGEQEITAAALPAPRAAARTGGATMQPRATAAAGAVEYVEVAIGSSIADVERKLILATVAACRGNKQRAANLLGVSLKTLYTRLNAYRA
jgi:two-component system, NtrC family, response regulator HydG